VHQMAIQQQDQFEFAGLDFAILALYVVAVLVLGFWVGRGRKNVDEFFLGGRAAIWPLVGFGLIAVNFSGTSYIGIAGAGYDEGIAVWNYEWMATIVLVFFALFIIPFYLRSKVSTMPEFLEKRYDRKARYAFSGFTVFTAMFIDSAGAMFAGAITLQLLFPDVPLMVLIAAVALLGGLYVVMGGLHAVHITDLVQGILLFLGGAVIFFAAWSELGFSWAEIENVAPEGGMTVAPPPDDEFLPWPGIFTGVLWLGLYYWVTNHVTVQKVLSAKSINHGRWGAIFAGFMQLPFLFILVLPGTIGRAIYPDIEQGDQIWPALAFEFLPVGIRGLILAALVAALMSTLDSVLNGAASLVTNDFIRTRKREWSDRQLLFIGRALVAGFMVVAALWAPQIANFPGIVEYFQSFLGAITMPVVVIVLGGLFWPRATRPAGFWTLVLVAPVGLVMFFVNEIFEVTEIQFLYLAGIMLAISLVVYVGISLATEAPQREELREYMWTRREWRAESEEIAELPWWQNYRVLGFGTLALTAVMIAFFI
jgi:solute:Na+ symporter, SSS family